MKNFNINNEEHQDWLIERLGKWINDYLDDIDIKVKYYSDVAVYRGETLDSVESEHGVSTYNSPTGQYIILLSLETIEKTSRIFKVESCISGERLSKLVTSYRFHKYVDSQLIKPLIYGLVCLK